MSDEAAKLFELALTLPADERAALGHQLIDSAGTDDGLPDDPDWRAELDRRLQSVADGTAVLVDGDETFRAARERLQQRRQS